MRFKASVEPLTLSFPPLPTPLPATCPHNGYPHAQDIALPTGPTRVNHAKTPRNQSAPQLFRTTRDLRGRGWDKSILQLLVILEGEPLSFAFVFCLHPFLLRLARGIV